MILLHLPSPYPPCQAVILVETTTMTSMARDLIDAGHFVVCPVMSLRSAMAVYMWDQAVTAGCQVIAVQDLWMEHRDAIQPSQSGDEGRGELTRETELRRHRERGEKGGYEAVREGDLVEVPLLASLKQGVQVQCLKELNEYACTHAPWAPVVEPVVWA